MVTSFLATVSMILVALYTTCTTRCVDTDGGDNKYEPGEAYTILECSNGETHTLGGLMDSCIIVPGFPEDCYQVDSCFQENCVLNEVNCVEGNPLAKNHHCPNGCSNGACIELEETETNSEPITEEETWQGENPDAIIGLLEWLGIL